MSDRLDERVARLRLKKRIDKIEEQKKEIDDEIEKKEITIEEVMNQIKEGEVTINGVTIRFEEKEYLDGRIRVYVPIDYLIEKERSNNTTFVLVNDRLGISLMANYSEYTVKKQTFAQFKKGLEAQFKKNELFLEWLDEGICSDGKSPYGIYRTPTGKGEIYNAIFMKNYKDSIIIGNYNCFYKDLDTWELIIKATMKLMKFK